MNLLAILGLGLLLGMQHATEGDHLAAVAALVGRDRSLARGVRHGVAWGLGHTLMLLIVAGGVGLLGWAISPELAGRFEQVVGAMLVGLGLHLAWRLWRERYHFHGHRHGAVAHFHGHSHAQAVPQQMPHGRDPHRHEHRMPARSLAVGMVHGLAGSAALALLVGQTLPSPAWGLLYIVVFGLGSVLGMALLSGALAWTIGLSAKRLTRIHQWFGAVASVVSVTLGGHLLLAGF
jgi:ABC-type nickel/cobalt efflux system permease component RcnA